MLAFWFWVLYPKHHHNIFHEFVLSDHQHILVFCIQIFRIISWFWFWTQCHNRTQWEANHWSRPHYHYCYHTDSTRVSWRVRGRGVPIPLADVGASTFFCWKRQPKEPDLSRSHQDIGSSNNTTPATLQHRLAKPRTRCWYYNEQYNIIMSDK